MLIACWSPKGGCGATVVAVGLASVLARPDAPVTLADLAGDLADACGSASPPGPGLAGWLGAPTAPPPGALARLAVGLGPGLDLLPLGPGWAPGAPGDPSTRAGVLAELWAAGPGLVVADGGSVASGVRSALLGRAQASVMVLRPCYLALRRALALGPGARPTVVAVVGEPGRSLGSGDVAQVLGVPVVEVPHHPSVARRVDAGLLAGRLPRLLERSMRRLAEAVATGRALEVPPPGSAPVPGR